MVLHSGPAFAQGISVEYPAGTPLENNRVVVWGDSGLDPRPVVPIGLSGGAGCRSGIPPLRGFEE